MSRSHHPKEFFSPQVALRKSLLLLYTTFATLGYGDLHYGAEHPLLRITSTLEAFIGAVIISLFVVVLSKKILR
ncbi:MAG: two pore domain potassium channel family protein [Nitrospirae bacterium]|nr:two pore domain potassium channel family protein [Nitrospirota bacterium]